jgi:transposase
MIQAPEVEHWIMHYELSDCEWSVIKPMLPNKPHGIPRVDDRRVLNGIFWALRSGAHDAAVWMIDTSIVRVHQHGACIAGNSKQDMGRSRGGWTSKVHAVVDANGLPVRLGLSPGEAHDNRLCPVLLAGLRPRTMVLAERGYDADWIREFVNHQGA